MFSSMFIIVLVIFQPFSSSLTRSIFMNGCYFVYLNIHFPHHHHTHASLSIYIHLSVSVCWFGYVDIPLSYSHLCSVILAFTCTTEIHKHIRSFIIQSTWLFHLPWIFAFLSPLFSVYSFWSHKNDRLSVFFFVVYIRWKKIRVHTCNAYNNKYYFWRLFHLKLIYQSFTLI